MTTEAKLEYKLDAIVEELREVAKGQAVLDSRFSDFKEWHRSYVEEERKSRDKLELRLSDVESKLAARAGLLETGQANLKGRALVVGGITLVVFSAVVNAVVAAVLR